LVDKMEEFIAEFYDYIEDLETKRSTRLYRICLFDHTKHCDLKCPNMKIKPEEDGSFRFACFCTKVIPPYRMVTIREEDKRRLREDGRNNEL